VAHSVHRPCPPLAGCSFSPCSPRSRVRSLRSALRALDVGCARRGATSVGEGRTGGLRTPGGPSDRPERASHLVTFRVADAGALLASPTKAGRSSSAAQTSQLPGDCAQTLGGGVVGQPPLLRPLKRSQHLLEIGAQHAPSPTRLTKSADRRMTSWRLLDLRIDSTKTANRVAPPGSDRPGLKPTERARR
jgi:hypothetical protein